jgi:hypothetical protein
MTSPTEPSPTPSASASTHTLYPDVLNPMEDSQTTNVSFAAPMTKQVLQKIDRQRYVYGALSDAQNRPASSQNQSPRTTQNTESVHLPPSFTEHDLDFDLSAYNDLFNTSSGYKQAIFPGWFVTSFDEHDLFAGPQFRHANFEVQERVY